MKTVSCITDRASCTTWTIKFLLVQGEKPLHCSQKEEFRQAEGQTAGKHHMIPWQVVKASKGFVSQDALALSGGTGSVTQREEPAPTNSPTPIPGTLQTVLQYFRQWLELFLFCMWILHFKFLPTSKAAVFWHRDACSWEVIHMRQEEGFTRK